VRLKPDALIDVLFNYIAKKDSFEVREVNVYEGMLRATGPAGGERIVQNLARLLDRAGGDPDKVFWIYKKMAFTVLRDTGKASGIPVLKKYLADPGSYESTQTNARTGVTKRQEITFRSRCQGVIDAIKRSRR
jgi:hypothetical protein